MREISRQQAGSVAEAEKIFRETKTNELKVLYDQQPGLENLIAFKKRKQAPQEELDALNKQLEQVQSGIKAIMELISSRELEMRPDDDEKYKRYRTLPYEGYSYGGQVLPHSDLAKRDSRLDLGGNYEGRWHAKKDYYNGDGNGV